MRIHCLKHKSTNSVFYYILELSVKVFVGTFNKERPSLNIVKMMYIDVKIVKHYLGWTASGCRRGRAAPRAAASSSSLQGILIINFNGPAAQV